MSSHDAADTTLKTTRPPRGSSAKPENNFRSAPLFSLECDTMMVERPSIVERYDFRRTLIAQLVRILIIPPLFTHVLLSIIPLDLHIALHSLALVCSVPLLYLIRCRWTTFLHSREAARLGARTVPEVVGRWPASIDLVGRMSFWSRTRYVAYGEARMMADSSSSTVNWKPLGLNLITTIDPAVVKYILATGFEKFSKGSLSKEVMESFLGNGIFNRDGAIWKMHRAMTRPFFARERVSDFAIFARHTVTTIDLLNTIATSPIPVLDAQDLFTRFTLDATTDFLFGRCLHTLKGPRPAPGEATCGPKGSQAPGDDGGFADFAGAFERMQVLVSNRFRNAFWRLNEFFDDSTRGPTQVIKAYLDPIVQGAIEEKKQNEKDGVDGEETLLQHLVKCSDDADLIRDQLLNILIAGRDTTAALLTFALYCLAMHPEVEEILREEIVRCAGGSEPTYESIKEMKYLRAVINETLRLFPPIPANLRESGPEGCLVPSSIPTEKPLYIPPNTAVFYTPILIHRRRDIWGEDAEDFKPERWMNAEKVAKYFTDCAFIPFNLGPRICLGQQFAYTETSYLLASLLPRFKFSLAAEYQPEGSLPPTDWRSPIAPEDVGVRSKREQMESIRPMNAITLYVIGGLWMKVTKI